MEITGVFREINEWLDRHLKTPQGLPVYKLVWSDDAREKRHGTFTDFTESGVYLRTVTETRLTRKYSYIRERWLLEKWFSPEYTISSELPESLKGGYELVWLFETRDEQYQAPTLRATQFLIGFIENNTPESSMRRRSRLADEVFNIEEKEIADFLNVLDVDKMII